MRILLVALPLLVALAIWLSPLAFVPVPWPDDAAFYFVGRDLFQWPPRWVMLPQAPFEPTYRIWNFNTMPLYPILMGLGRFIGIDGAFGVKLWPLLFFALSGSVLSAWSWRLGLHWAAALLVGLALMLDPGMRWASVLARPESLIGLCGVAIVLGLSFGFPERWRARGRFWDPLAALLAIAAYAHFNAIHLLFPVVLHFAFARDWRGLARTGLITALYLTPWLLTVALHPSLFFYQMEVQWTRLAVHNDWLDSPKKAIDGIFQSLGSPEPWPDSLKPTAYAIWALLISAIALGLAAPAARLLGRRGRQSSGPRPFDRAMIPAGGWVLGSVWLWHSKPEVWFNYYVHLSAWVFAGVAAVLAWRAHSAAEEGPRAAGQFAAGVLAAVLGYVTVMFGYVDVAQARRLGATPSWNWDAYHRYVDCIDEELVELETRLGRPKPFRVWGPTFPDVLIELSRRHPEWELTRVNDFWERDPLALQHGRDVEAVVVTETINWAERDIDAPMKDYPTLQSIWMTWDAHFLNKLWKEEGWKPNRHLCQKGRWVAFIFAK